MPHVMSSTGGMGRAIVTFYKGLASMSREKRNGKMTNYICYHLRFALLLILILMEHMYR